MKPSDGAVFHGLKFDAVNENLPEMIKLFGSDSRKVFADYYLDDKNLSLIDCEKVGASL